MKWYKLLYKITGKLKVQQPIRSADVNGDVILEARPNLVSMAWPWELHWQCLASPSNSRTDNCCQSKIKSYNQGDHIPDNVKSPDNSMTWYSRVYRPTWYIIGHFGDDFTGQMTQPKVCGTPAHVRCYSYHASTSVIVSGEGRNATVHPPKPKWNAQAQQIQEWTQINSFRQLFPNKIFSMTLPWLLVKSLTFPWQLSKSLTFSGEGNLRPRRPPREYLREYTSRGKPKIPPAAHTRRRR